jgi:hypothetical protein
VRARRPAGTVVHSDSETVRTGIPGVLDSHCSALRSRQESKLRRLPEGLKGRDENCDKDYQTE